MTDQSIGRKLGERLVHRDRDQSTALLTQMRTQATQKPRSGNQNQSVETTGLTTLLDTCPDTKSWCNLECIVTSRGAS